MNQLSMEIIRFNKKVFNHLFIYLDYFSPDNLAFFFKQILLEYSCFTMLFSVVQPSELAIYRHISPSFWISFPLGHIEH